MKFHLWKKGKKKITCCFEKKANEMHFMMWVCEGVLLNFVLFWRVQSHLQYLIMWSKEVFSIKFNHWMRIAEKKKRQNVIVFSSWFVYGKWPRSWWLEMLPINWPILCLWFFLGKWQTAWKKEAKWYKYEETPATSKSLILRRAKQVFVNLT